MGKHKARKRGRTGGRSGTGNGTEATTGASGDNTGKNSAGTGAGTTGGTGDSTGEKSLERVGVLSMNTVEINEANLIAEADAALLLNTSTDIAGTIGGAPAVAQPASWLPAVQGITPMMRIGVFPQWDISEPEAKEFAEALAQCLDQTFPGGLDGPYACWFRLIAAGGGICAVRYMQHGKLPPLGPKRAVPEKKQNSDANTNDAAGNAH